LDVFASHFIVMAIFLLIIWIALMMKN